MSVLFEPPCLGGEPHASIAERLAAADRVLQREKGVTAFLRSVSWMGGFVLVSFAADVALHLAPMARLSLLGAGLALLAAVGVVCAYLAWVRRSAPEHTARVLESRDPALGSKLINLLQLRAHTDDPRLAPLTRDLARDAVAAYAEELSAVDLRRFAHSESPRREAKRAGWFCLSFLTVLGLGFDITRTEVLRFLDPFGDHPPYSFTRIEISDPADDSALVVYGQGLLVQAKAGGHRPGELFLTYFAPGEPGKTATVPMFDKGARGFAQRIDGITSNLFVVAHTKNGHSRSKQRRVGVILTPKLDRAFIKITPPAYTALPPEERPLQFKTLKALAGSALDFRVTSNRPLREGRIEVIKSPDDVQTITMTPSTEHEVTGTVTAGDSARMRFSLIDRDGHASQETWELALTVTHDLPPEVQITNPSGDAFVAMDFTVDAVIEANDDYGVKTVRIHQAHNGVWMEPKVVTYDKVSRFAREGLTLDFKEMPVESGDTCSFFAEAIDTAPEPHMARSKTITLTVITSEEYNDFLRERTDLADIQAKYADLIRQFHDLAEEQKKLGEQSGSLEQQLEVAKDKQARDALQQKLDQLLAQQNEVNSKLNKLADTMENFVRAQPLYDVEAELQETLREKAQQVRASTAANSRASEQIAQRSSPRPGERQLDQQMFDDFKQASDEQLAALGAAEQEAQDEIVQPLEEMAQLHEIVKDLNRFKELYAAQSELAEQSKAYAREAPLTREDQLALKDLAAREKQIGEELEAVEQKLWEDGKAAMEKFPKAGQSAQDIAQQMGDLRLQTLANQATSAMLAGRGENGSQLAGRLRDEMEKLFSECNSQGGQMSNELDQRMSLSRGLNMRNSFQQMMQSRKFGSGSKPGFGQSSGPGMSGSEGNAVITGPDARALGNETSISSNSSLPGAQGRNQATLGGGKPEVAVDKPDVVQGVNAVNRESEAVQGETSIEQYSDVVEKYFKAITK